MTPQDQEAVERLTKLANTEIDQHNGRPWPLGPLEMVQHTADLRHLLSLSQGWKPDRAALAVRLGSFPMQDEDLGPDNEVLIDLLPRSPADDQPGETMLYRLVDAILALTAPKDEGWRPIESAPKGKTVLAGYRNALGNWRTVRATYYLAGTLEASEDLDDSIVDENGCAPEGWYEECETRDDILPCDHDPTHWRPLPTAPTQSAGGTD